MGELRMVMLYLGHVLGWLLAHLLKGLIFACTLPWRIYRFFLGARYVWMEYLVWLAAFDFAGRFVHEYRHEGLSFWQLCYPAALGVLFSISLALSEIPSRSPLRWLAWRPGLGRSKGHVDVSAERGFQVLRGTRLVRVEPQAAPVHDLRLSIAHIPINSGEECQHFLIAGRTGAGKSQVIQAMLRKVRQREQPAVIADPGGSYLSRFGMEDALVLNPFDLRDAGWSPFAEIRAAYDCQRLAKAAIPDAEGDARQWHFYAQTLLGETLQALWKNRFPSVRELLRLVIAAEQEELAQLLANTPAAALTMPTNDRMLSNTRAIASVYLNAWSHLQDRGEFSVRDWVRGAAAGKKMPWLYLVYRDDQMALLRLLIATWLDLAIVETLGLDEQPSRRIWFVMDEADSLGKVASLRDGLTKLRKYGGAVVAGLQTIAQLRSTYGRDEAQVLLSCLSTKLVLAAGDSETARYFEQELGTQEIERVQVSQSDSRQKLDPLAGSLGKSAHAMRSTQATVLASEISRLPNLHGFLVTGGHPIVRVTVPYQDMAVVREPFVSVPQ